MVETYKEELYRKTVFWRELKIDGLELPPAVPNGHKHAWRVDTSSKKPETIWYHCMICGSGGNISRNLYPPKIMTRAR